MTGIRRRSLSALDCHLNPLLRSQRDQCPRLDPLACDESCTPSRSQSRQHENSLRPRESFSDTASGTSSKWKVAIRISGLFRFRCPAFRIESFRIREESRIAMGYKRAQQDDRIGRHNVGSDSLLRKGLRPIAQAGGYKRIDSETIISVYVSRGISSKVGVLPQNLIQFRMQLLYLRMLRQQIPGPGQGIGRRFMPREE